MEGMIVGASFEDELLQKAIHYLKYESVKKLASPLSKIYPKEVLKEVGSQEDSILIPVPSHKAKLRERGYNQAELLAFELDKGLNFGVKSDILAKSRSTKSQMTLDKSERLVNMEGAFECLKPDEVRGKTVFLIDDICTTGTTLKECAKTLSEHNPKEIWATVIARGK